MTTGKEIIEWITKNHLEDEVITADGRNCLCASKVYKGFSEDWIFYCDAEYDKELHEIGIFKDGNVVAYIDLINGVFEEEEC